MALLHIDPATDRKLTLARAREHMAGSLKWLALAIRHIQLGGFADAHFCLTESRIEFAKAGIYADAVQGTDETAA